MRKILHIRRVFLPLHLQGEAAALSLNQRPLYQVSPTLLSGASRGSKRKEPADPSLPTTKRPRKKVQPLDEETQVALALCSSLLEREKELEREAAAALAAVTANEDHIYAWDKSGVLPKMV